MSGVTESKSEPSSDTEISTCDYPETVVLQAVSSDGSFVDVEVPGEIIGKASGLIHEVLDDEGSNDAIPLPAVKEKQLKYIIEWYIKYFDEPFEIPVNDTSEDIPEDVDENSPWFTLKPGTLVDNGFPLWAEKILDDIPLTSEPVKDHGFHKNLFDLLNACDYLQCSTLHSFIILKISSFVSGKEPEEIRKFFAMENDFDDADEFHYEDKKIRGKNEDGTDAFNEDGTPVFYIQKVKVWDKLTEETAKTLNSVPV